MINKTVRQILDHKGYQLYTVGAEDTVLKALEEMAAKNIGALLVFDGQRLAGLITERDCARKLDLLGRSAGSTAVRRVMQRDPVTVTSDTTMDMCLRLMTERRVRHLPVVDDIVIGLISIGDVGKATISSQRNLIDDLTSYITGSPR